MAIHKIKVISSEVKKVNGVMCAPSVWECVCDFRSDVEGQTADETLFLTGSTVKCIEGSSQFMLDGDLNWVEVNFSGGGGSPGPPGPPPEPDPPVGWQPRGDWWDIETMVETGIVPWESAPLVDARYGFIVSDGRDTTKLLAGYKYYLSDGSYYNTGATGLNASYVHTWDRAYDKPCADGYKTRAVIVCDSDQVREVRIEQRDFDTDGVASLYIYLGDCEYTIFAGNANPPYGNKTLRAVKAGPNSTGRYLASTSFEHCTALEAVILGDGFTNSSGELIDGCTSIVSLIATSLVNAPYNTFRDCTALTGLVTADNYGAANTKLNWSPFLSVSSIENLINVFMDRTGLTALVLTLGPINLAKLSSDIMAVAAAKNITLA